MARSRIKNLLFVCTVLLGIQFFFPLATMAGNGAKFTEETSLATKDVEKDGCRTLDLDVVDVFFVSSNVGSIRMSPESEHLLDGVLAQCAVLPTAGFHPSAP